MNIRHSAIILRFPEYKDRILKQIGENIDFECLCSDYGECTELLESLTAATDRNDFALEQYMEIKIELEREVMRFLSK